MRQVGIALGEANPVLADGFTSQTECWQLPRRATCPVPGSSTALSCQPTAWIRDRQFPAQRWCQLRRLQRRPARPGCPGSERLGRRAFAGADCRRRWATPTPWPAHHAAADPSRVVFHLGVRRFGANPLSAVQGRIPTSRHALRGRVEPHCLPRVHCVRAAPDSTAGVGMRSMTAMT